MLHKFDFDKFQNGYTLELRDLGKSDAINMLLSVCIQYFDKNLYPGYFNGNGSIDDLLNINLTPGAELPNGAKKLFRRFATAHARDKLESMIGNLNLNDEERALLTAESNNIGSFINQLINGDPADPGKMEADTVHAFNIFRSCFRRLKNTPADQRNQFLQSNAADKAADEEAAIKLLKALHEAHKSANKEVKKTLLFANKDFFRSEYTTFRALPAEEKETILEKLARALGEEKQTVVELANIISSFDKIESAREGNTVTVNSVDEAREISEQGGIVDVAKTVSLKDSKTVSNVIHQNNVEANNAIVKRGWC